MEKKLAKLDEFTNHHKSFFLTVGIILMVFLIGTTVYNWRLVYLTHQNGLNQLKEVGQFGPENNSQPDDDIGFEEYTPSQPISEDQIAANLSALAEIAAENSSSSDVTQRNLSGNDHENALSALQEMESVPEIEVTEE